MPPLDDPDILISTDPALLDFDVIHGFLSTCYWSPGIPRETIQRAAANSMCFGVYDRAAAPPAARADGHPAQVGFARVISDRATFAYLADVFILESHRARGLGRRLVAAILAHPDLQNLRRFCLLTRDAHGLYAPFGFAPMIDPTRYMERLTPSRP